MTFESYLEDLPLLHSWDNGRTWNTGGFDRAQLRNIHDLALERFGREARVIETGAGNSTITFLHLEPQRVVTIAPVERLRARILEHCAATGVPTGALDFRLGRSEVVLPEIALATPRPRFDVALIDGGHGWPTVFVDFCYFHMLLGRGGLLLLDDTQLHSVAELSRLLAQQPSFSLVAEWGKLQVWEKAVDDPFLPEHNGQPYIVEMSRPPALPNAERPRRRLLLRSKER